MEARNGLCQRNSKDATKDFFLLTVDLHQRVWINLQMDVGTEIIGMI